MATSQLFLVVDANYCSSPDARPLFSLGLPHCVSPRCLFTWTSWCTKSSLTTSSSSLVPWAERQGTCGSNTRAGVGGSLDARVGDRKQWWPRSVCEKGLAAAPGSRPRRLFCRQSLASPFILEAWTKQRGLRIRKSFQVSPSQRKQSLVLGNIPEDRTPATSPSTAHDVLQQYHRSKRSVYLHSIRGSHIFFFCLF